MGVLPPSCPMLYFQAERSPYFTDNPQHQQGWMFSRNDLSLWVSNVECDSWSCQGQPITVTEGKPLFNKQLIPDIYWGRLSVSISVSSGSATWLPKTWEKCERLQILTSHRWLHTSRKPQHNEKTTTAIPNIINVGRIHPSVRFKNSTSSVHKWVSLGLGHIFPVQSEEYAYVNFSPIIRGERCQHWLVFLQIPDKK